MPQFSAIGSLQRLCLLGLWLGVLSLSLSHVAAQQQVTAPLEQQLDQYLVTLREDPVKADALLTDLYQRYYLNPNTDIALASQVRLLSYQASHLLHLQRQTAADALLAELLKLTNDTNNPDILSEIYATEIEFLLYQRQLSAAILKADRLELIVQNASVPRVQYFANAMLGGLFKTDNQFEQALQHYTDALDAIIATDDQFTLRRRANLNYFIAQVYADLKKWPEAKLLTEELIAAAKKYQYPQFLPDLYLMLGFILAEQNDLNAAVAVNQLGVAAAKAVDRPNIELTFENNLGSIYIEQQKYEEARAVLQAASEQATSLNDEFNVQIMAYNLGYIDVMQGEHKRGLEQMLAALQYFKENDTKAQYEPMLQWLAKAYAAAGQFQLQAQTLQQQLELRAEILTSEREKSVAELQNRYDTKAKSQLITILEQENDLKAQLLDNQKLQQQITALFTLVLIFAAVMLYQLYRKVRQSNRKLREANKQLEFQSLRDPLTGLYNRRALQEQMQRREKYGRRQTDSSPSANGFLLLDIDYFKKINDNYGHAAGDEVLTQLSARLTKVCRDEDLVIRWGGEEFLLYLEHIAPEQVSGFCQRILDIIASEPVQCDGKLIPVSASGGFIHLPFAGVDETDLNWERALQIADMALYLSKVHGRNQVYAITGLRCDYDSARQALTNDLQGAIQQNMVDYITIKGPALPG
ncbi:MULTISPECIES: tetratricopeptide repeat-containing diguanylate cyclase [unclassified Arsukibacterium]|uniref:tetratricopeptide repeat-containing diguanylate cyclase n=1 Tax=unclassified Arsukibacterium TaxID=2635278 RepID=UPI000C525435|nr:MULTISPECIES: GGDEF domain-containing protein [unclassified Arsukibacterium]MAA96218.1 GGDEF domain-containing protein [Rheinheimera sp.]MBM35035.1 GGDEF domain-containing protein [Rheinheimera sp.]|tara:strand:+ start:5830 stop:7920 length:2091 start_codon:yes stop_codon:yes gene_type:complete